jgi:methionine biosynthesis protein MetW
MPVTNSLPLKWYNTPNIHLCTILDFAALCEELGIVVERALIINGDGRASEIRSLRRANLLGEQGMFLLRGR